MQVPNIYEKKDLIDSLSLHLLNFENEEEVAAIYTRSKELEEMPLKLK